MSDNELDDLFKEAAEGFKPPQDSSAWQQMATKLDQTTPTTGFWNWKSISAVSVAAIVTLTTTWYALKSEQQTLKSEQLVSNNPTPSVVQEQKKQSDQTSKQDIQATESLEDKGNGHDAVRPKLKSQSGIAQRRSQSKAKKEEATHKTVKQNAVSSEDLSQIQEQPVEVIVSENVNSGNNAASANVSSIGNEREVLQENSVVSDSVLASSKIERDSVTQITEESRNEQKKLRSHSGFSVKATISPDFSSVNFFSAGKTGFNYGFLAGYSFNNRWSVYTGVLSSKKLYTSDEVEGSYSSAGHDYPVKELDGDCRILDIPVNVYYSFFPERSFSLSLGLGLSSYIMRKETYVYCVDNYGSDVYYEQRIRGKNNEWFKVLNVSVIASKKLTNRLSAEFEPFVKAPLAGVGEGKVSLVSMGAFFNLKYDLSIHK